MVTEYGFCPTIERELYVKKVGIRMKFYESNDMVKVGCHDCEGCSVCCRGMGDTILLDPLDVFYLTEGLQRNVQELLSDCVALHVEEGLILPHLKMTGAQEQCTFLNEKGRCSIHAFRPGLCRTFPLGRNFSDGKMNYFLVEGECPMKNRTKMKVEKWIGTPDFQKNKEFLTEWHYLVKALKTQIRTITEQRPESEKDELVQKLNMQFLQCFYLKPYEKEVDFYSQFETRKRIFEMQEK